MAQNALYLAARLKEPSLHSTALINVATLVGPSPKALEVCAGCASTLTCACFSEGAGASLWLLKVAAT